MCVKCLENNHWRDKKKSSNLIAENILQLLDGIQFYIMFAINTTECNIVNKEENGGILTFI